MKPHSEMPGAEGLSYIRGEKGHNSFHNKGSPKILMV